MQLVGRTAQAAARKLRRASLNVFIVVGGLRDGAATASVRLAVREHTKTNITEILKNCAKVYPE